MGSRYNDSQYADNYPDGVERHYWNVARNALVLRTIAASNRLVLDVGCGRGVVVDYLRAQGINCWGCEVGTPRPLTATVGPFLMLGTDALQVGEAVADQVSQLLFLDVLEHLEHPTNLLTGCLERFRNVQRITITLPARTELWTNYDERFGHYRRYDSRSLGELISSLSARQARVFYFFRALYPAILVTALIGTGRQTKVRAPASNGALRAHRLFGNALRLADRVLPSWVPGSSICAVVDL
jgi:hypothetical protein